MRPPRRLATSVALTALTAGLLLGTSPATAAPPTRITEPLEETFLAEDFCDVAGLTVEIVDDGEEVVTVAERRGETYFSSHVRVERTFTNTATGATFTAREITHSTDLRVTDNGDGTLTVVYFGTGFAMMFGPDGRIIGKNTGQSRVQAVIDLKGTPDNFDDDELISEELILGSTGTNDDFCEVAVSALT